MAAGAVPTGTVATTILVVPSMTDTSLLTLLAVYTVFVFSLTATDTGTARH